MQESGLWPTPLGQQGPDQPLLEFYPWMLLLMGLPCLPFDPVYLGVMTGWGEDNITPHWNLIHDLQRVGPALRLHRFLHQRATYHRHVPRYCLLWNCLRRRSRWDHPTLRK